MHLLKPKLIVLSQQIIIHLKKIASKATPKIFILSSLKKKIKRAIKNFKRKIGKQRILWIKWKLEETQRAVFRQFSYRQIRVRKTYQGKWKMPVMVYIKAKAKKDFTKSMLKNRLIEILRSLSPTSKYKQKSLIM